MKLLIAEDAASTRLMLNAVATKWGFDVVLAEDGQEAWDVMRGEDAPRLALLDWEMPHMDGLEVCRRVRATEQQKPPYILLLSGRHEDSDIAEGLEAGVDEHVAKPFDAAELEARLRMGRRMLALQREFRAMQSDSAAGRDALTGFLNPVATKNALERQVVRARHEGIPMHIGLIEIYALEDIGDTHGHSAADAVVKELARRLGAALRPYDLAGRGDGGVFLLLVNGDATHARILFEHFVRAIVDAPFVHEQKTLPVSVSCGVVSFAPPKDARDAAELFAAADAALARSRLDGQNKTTFAQ